MNLAGKNFLTPPLNLLVLAIMASALAFGACDKSQNTKGPGPLNLTREAASVVDGMILVDYPGPKGQAIKKDGTPDYFCDVPGLINALLDPDQSIRYGAAYVQPFDGRKWGSYTDNWIDVKIPVYVLGSDRMGAMGPTLVPFVEAGNAQTFVENHGGRIVEFANISVEVMAEHARESRKMLMEGAMSGKMEGHGAGSNSKSEQTGKSHDRN